MLCVDYLQSIMSDDSLHNILSVFESDALMMEKILMERDSGQWCAYFRDDDRTKLLKDTSL